MRALSARSSKWLVTRDTQRKGTAKTQQSDTQNARAAPLFYTKKVKKKRNAERENKDN